MYHIKEKKDKRIQKSVAALSLGLTYCLKKDKLRDISVTDITKASGVSRATFYRLFDTTWDLLLYSCDNITKELFNEMMKPNRFRTKHEFMLFTINFILEHATIIEAVYDNGRPDILGKSLSLFSETVAKFYMKDYDDTDIEYMRYMISAMIVGGLYVWRNHGRAQTAEQVLEMIEKVTIHFNEKDQNLRIL